MLRAQWMFAPISVTFVYVLSCETSVRGKVKINIIWLPLLATLAFRTSG